MTKEKREFGLEDRLINFSMVICDIVESLPNTRVANHFAGQIVRSGTSPAFNYGEAQEAQSRNDFIHKMSLCRKELRETKIALKMISRRKFKETQPPIESALKENVELLAIFSASIKTARSTK